MSSLSYKNNLSLFLKGTIPSDNVCLVTFFIPSIFINLYYINKDSYSSFVTGEVVV